ncbi:hypothetical protein M2140_001608 [Clostridiales Family XIII bacterium PM5-7]
MSKMSELSLTIEKLHKCGNALIGIAENLTDLFSGSGDISSDDGISGTNTKKREQFNIMIDECEAGNIDMIITKSISRFARNTLDCLKYIRQLKDKNNPFSLRKRTSTQWILKERLCSRLWQALHSRKASL